MKKLLIVYRSGQRVTFEYDEKENIFEKIIQTMTDKTNAFVYFNSLQVAVYTDRIDHMEVLK